MNSVREVSQKLISDFDNESSFIILLSVAMIPFLEEPLNRARFFEYNKKLELYFDSKDINRFTRVKKLTTIIAERVNGKVRGFERILKLCRENGVLEREKEGPSEGMAWQGFGGVHSHYNLTELGRAILIFQTSLRCSAVDFTKITTFENWDEVIQIELDMIIQSVVNKSLKIRSRENYFNEKREAKAIIIQLIFEYIAGNNKKISLEEIKNYIIEKAGEIHLGEIPGALDKLKGLLTISGDTYSLNGKGVRARVGYANLLVEAALTIDDTEVIHHMVTAKKLETGSKELLKNYALWF